MPTQRVFEAKRRAFRHMVKDRHVEVLCMFKYFKRESGDDSHPFIFSLKNEGEDCGKEVPGEYMKTRSSTLRALRRTVKAMEVVIF
jgi:hypothetical protein